MQQLSTVQAHRQFQVTLMNGTGNNARILEEVDNRFGDDPKVPSVV
jgi:hypothetical protein